MRKERPKLSRGSDLAKAMDYMLKRWSAFTRFLDDGRICLTTYVFDKRFLDLKSWYCPFARVTAR